MKQMIRTQIYLTPKQHSFFRKAAKRRKTNVSAEIRESLDKTIDSSSDKARRDALNAAAGIWKDRADLTDEFFTKNRKSFDREHVKKTWYDRDE